MPRHVVLIGLPGAGKSTAGRLAATLLGAPIVDLDAAIVRRTQMPITRIFAEFGEARFRELEQEAVGEALAGPPALLVPGGGWAAQPGSLELVRGRALVLYLEVRPSVAAARLAPDHDRPLLLSEDPVGRMGELLRNREAFYKRADRTIPNEKYLPEQTGAEVARLARELAGW
jgi:shikimate kinase